MMSAFYIFSLPLLSGALAWLLTLIAVNLIGSILLYVARRTAGAERPEQACLSDPTRDAIWACSSPPCSRSWRSQAWLAPARQLLEPSGLIFGASYADVAIRIPAARILFVVALAGVVLSLLSSRGRLRPVLIAIGLYVATSIGGEAVASAVQRFVVAPNEQARETPYMAYNIAATREAFGLDNVEERELTGDAHARRAPTSSRNAATLEQHASLGPPAAARHLRPAAGDPAVLRLRVGGQRPLHRSTASTRQVMLSARELNSQALPNRTWINEHLTFTHGYGLTLGPVNQVTQRRPAGAVHQGPAAGLDRRPRRDRAAASTSASCRTTTSSSARTRRSSTTRAATTTSRPTTTAAAACRSTRPGASCSSPCGSARSRSSSATTSPTTSRVLFHRRIDERRPADRAVPRATTATPTSWSPTGACTGCRTRTRRSDSYPYSTPATSEINYIRNSVKIVVDAYHGTTSFYLADPTDPIALDHRPRRSRVCCSRSTRCPPSFARTSGTRSTSSRCRRPCSRPIHMTNPVVFYNKEDQWEMPTIDDDKTQPMQPYYTIMRLPGETEAEFIQMVPLTPRRKDNLAAWMVARKRRRALRPAARLPVPEAESRLRPAPGRGADQPGSGDLAADHAVEPAGLAGDSGHAAGDSDRGVAALRPAALPAQARAAGSRSSSASSSRIRTRS